jgi:amino acid permease
MVLRPPIECTVFRHLAAALPFADRLQQAANAATAHSPSGRGDMATSLRQVSHSEDIVVLSAVISSGNSNIFASGRMLASLAA